ncbi:MAG: hypothetical protein AAF391_03675 [Bacteroidota bacterium]
MRPLHFKQLSLVIIFLFVACQDDSINIEPIEELDEDMLAATDLADDYLTSLGGRAAKAERSITVLKFKNGQLLYDTNRDTISGYHEVEETTITAYATPGEYIFWFAGGGVADLEEIDFDPAGDSVVGDFLDEINADHMWVVQVPNDVDPGVTEIKYDIVYQYNDGDSYSDYIRLDPKIRLDTQHSDDSGGSDDSSGSEGSGGESGGETGGDEN